MNNLDYLRMYAQPILQQFNLPERESNTRRKQSKDTKVDKTFDSILREKMELLQETE